MKITIESTGSQASELIGQLRDEVALFFNGGDHVIFQHSIVLRGLDDAGTYRATITAEGHPHR